MSESVLTALGFDREPMSGKFIAIEENDTADASFLLSSIVQHQTRNNVKIVLVLFHNSVGHYQSISLKLGYNLLALVDKGTIVVIELFKHIQKSLMLSVGDGNKFLDNVDALRDLYFEIEKEVHVENYCVVLENVSDLLLLDFKLSNVFIFTQFVKSLSNKNSCVVLSFHSMQSSDDTMALCNELKHGADIVVAVKELATGRALDVTGTFTVQWKHKADQSWNKQSEYHFQLMERNIKVFAPGMRNFS